MYEDDRNRALEMYEEIFEEVGNETAVLQLLVSPTRQAVNLARAYDARDRKYQSDDGQEPAYQLVIEDLRRQAGTLIPAAPKVEDDQISLFSDTEANENIFDSLGFNLMTDTQEDAAPAVQPPQEIVQFPDEDREGEPAPLSPPPAIPPAQIEDTPAQQIDDFSDAVDAFLADFTIHDELAENKDTDSEQVPIIAIQDEDTPLQAPPEPAFKKQEPARSKPEEESTPAPQPRPAAGTQSPAAQPAKQEPRSTAADLPDMTGTAVKKTNVPLLILFILLAIPVGLLCLAVILPLAVIALGLAGASLYVGFSGLIAAFSFSVFADILLVFGLSLALAAIGLLLFWIFIWLLGGAIPGVVRGICSLGRKLCCKEVSA